MGVAPEVVLGVRTDSCDLCGAPVDERDLVATYIMQIDETAKVCVECQPDEDSRR